MAMGLIIKVANNFIELLQCAGHSFNAGKTGQANTSTMLIVQERGGGGLSARGETPFLSSCCVFVGT